MDRGNMTRFRIFRYIHLIHASDRSDRVSLDDIYWRCGTTKKKSRYYLYLMQQLGLIRRDGEAQSEFYTYHKPVDCYRLTPLAHLLCDYYPYEKDYIKREPGIIRLKEMQQDLYQDRKKKK